MKPAERSQHGSAYRWLILAAFFLAMGLSGLGNFIYPAIGTFVKADLNLTATHLGMLGAASFFGAMLFNLFSGFVVDTLGVRKSALLCGVILVAGFGLSAVAGSFWVLVLLMVFMGVGLSFLNPLTQKGVFHWFRPQEVGLAVGVKQAGIPAGSAFNAALLPWIALRYGWQAAILACGGVAVAVLLLVLLTYRERPAVGGANDRPGPRPDFHNTLRLVGHRELLLVGIVGITHGALTISLVNFFVPITVDLVTLTPVVAAGFLSIMQLTSTLARPAVGFFSDWRTGEGRGRFLAIYIIAGSLMTAAWPYLMGLGLNGISLIALAVLLGLVNSWSGVYFTVVTELGGPEQAGVATGFGALANSLGTSTGPVLFGFMADRFGTWTPGLELFSALSILSGSALLLYVSRSGKPSCEVTS